ncbi:MAG: hypothetical protein LUG98_11950 [Tannerellaceae bacterium]|nr:hypothetical protein [Tannerellaceae bacterium]
MKKNVWYLLALLCCLNFFACSNDDDNGKGDGDGDGDDDKKDWTDYTATFGDKNLLLFNGEEITEGKVTAVFAEGAEEGKAKLTITGLGLWEGNEIVFDNLTVEEKNGVYAFESAENIGNTDTKLAVTGSLTPGTLSRETEPKEGSLTLTTSRTIESDVVGSWKLNFTEDETAGLIAGFDMELSALTASNPQLAALLPMMVGSLIGDKVEDVVIEFKADGTFDFKWWPLNGEDYLTLADVIPGGEYFSALLALDYYVEGNMIYLGVNGALINQILDLAGGMGIDLSGITPYLGLLDVLNDGKGYYSLGIKYAKENNAVRFYMDESLILPLLGKFMQVEGGSALLMMISQTQIPDLGTVGDLLNLVQASETMSVGLTFEPKVD